MDFVTLSRKNNSTDFDETSQYYSLFTKIGQTYILAITMPDCGGQ